MEKIEKKASGTDVVAESGQSGMLWLWTNLRTTVWKPDTLDQLFS